MSLRIRELASYLMKKKGWDQKQLSIACNTSEVSVGRYLKKTKDSPELRFNKKVVQLAFEAGLGAEAIESLLTDCNVSVSTAILATAMFPDLKEDELKELLDLEKKHASKPLPISGIRFVVEYLRMKRPRE